MRQHSKLTHCRKGIWHEMQKGVKRHVYLDDDGNWQEDIMPVRTGHICQVAGDCHLTCLPCAVAVIM